MIGVGLRKRAASRKASNWVLSPISASAMRPVEVRKAFIEGYYRLDACERCPILDADKLEGR